MNLMLLVMFGITANGQITISKNLGQLYFYGETRTLSYNLNLNSYYYNAKLFENNMQHLEKICGELPDNTQCLFYLRNFEYDLKIMKKNIEQIKKYSSTRARRWAAFIPRLFGAFGTRAALLSAVTGAGVSYAYNKINDEIKEDKQDEYNEVLEVSLNNTYKELINEKEERHDSNMLATKFREYEDVLHSTTLLANRHFRETSTFLSVLGDNIRTYFFSIVATRDFEYELDEIQKSLPDNLSIPLVNSFDMLELSKISVNKNPKHIQINVEIPIFHNKNHTLLLMQIQLIF